MRILALAGSLLSSVLFTGPAAAQMMRIQQVIGQNDLVPIEMAAGTPSYDFAKAVAYVTLGSAGCTGFRVAEDLFITNHHCYAAGSCASTKFTLGQERDLPRDRRTVLQCAAVLAYDSGLDYALYQVRTGTDGGMAEYPPMVLTSYLPPVGAPLFVPGYPCCENYKRADLSDACKLVAQSSGSGQTMAHGCDTISGSSGSPIIDRETGHVIALHWGYSQAGANNGTPMRAILEDIRTKAPEAFEKLSVSDR